MTKSEERLNDTREKFAVQAEATQAAARPRVKLVGRDGNAFAILGACQRAGRKAGWSPEKLKAVMADMTSGDYNHLLATAMQNFDVS